MWPCSAHVILRIEATCTPAFLEGELFRCIKISLYCFGETPGFVLDAFILPPSVDCICYTRGNNIEVALVGADKAPVPGSCSGILQTPRLFELMVSGVSCRWHKSSIVH